MLGKLILLKILISVLVPLAVLGIGYYLLTSDPPEIPPEVSLGTSDGAARFDAKLKAFGDEARKTKAAGQTKDMSIIFTEGEINSKLKQWVESAERKDWPIDIEWARAYFRDGVSYAAVRGGVSLVSVTALVIPVYNINNGNLTIRAKSVKFGRIPLPKAVTENIGIFFDQQLQKLDPLLPQHIPLQVRSVNFEKQQAVISGPPR